MKHEIDEKDLIRLIKSEMILMLFMNSLLGGDEDENMLATKKQIAGLIAFSESDEGLPHVESGLKKLLEIQEEKLIQTLA